MGTRTAPPGKEPGVEAASGKQLPFLGETCLLESKRRSGQGTSRFSRSALHGLSGRECTLQALRGRRETLQVWPPGAS